MKNIYIKIGLGSCGIAAGAKELYEYLLQNLSEFHDVDIKVIKTACNGMCFAEPIVEISSGINKSITYGNVTNELILNIIRDFISQNPYKKNILMSNYDDDIDTLASEKITLNTQNKIVLKNCGNIDPNSIDEYISAGGYTALENVIKNQSPEEIIQTIITSGLRGRGGAGFPTGRKWSILRESTKEYDGQIYLICNADEGDPGAFMDRSILEGDPHSVLEGMIIASFAMRATQGYIYVRAEYPQAILNLKIAIEQAYQRGYLGKNILSTKHSFDIFIKEGAGAFVCGEETALIASIEGKRGIPSIRPPYPAQKGLWEKPTNINNVETFANIPKIISMGAENFKKLGTEKSAGTKVFALAGKIKKPGLIEVEMGTPLSKIIFDIGGGMKGEKSFKAVQLGGPSGGCIPNDLIDTRVDYDNINQTGAIMGSGGMVIMDDDTCMVDVAKYFINFTQSESCGKCTFCRIGTKRLQKFLLELP